MSSNGAFLKVNGLEVSFNGSRLEHGHLADRYIGGNFHITYLTQRKGRDRAAGGKSRLCSVAGGFPVRQCCKKWPSQGSGYGGCSVLAPERLLA